MLKPSTGARRRQTGLTLVELMIAMVLGLIVVGATIALVVSLMRSNNESIRATRLTQELRAMSDIVTAELRRARSLNDPLANVGQGATAFMVCNAVIPAAPTPPSTGTSGACLVVASRCNPANGTGDFRIFRLDGTDLVYGTAAGVAAQACAATPSDARLNSNEVVMDQVNFTHLSSGAIQMVLQGHLSTDPSATKRTITRVIWPRSAPVVP